MKKFFVDYIYPFILGLIISFASYVIGVDRGLETGREQGVEGALDTISKIINAQIESDTTVTKLVMINPDTITYYLSPKTIR